MLSYSYNKFYASNGKFIFKCVMILKLNQMRFTRNILICKSTTKNIFRSYCFQSQFSPVVRVVSLDEDDTIKLSFKISKSPYLNVKAPKNQTVNAVLNRIKLMAELQRQREDIRRTVINKFSNTAQVVIETIDEHSDVCLFGNNDLIDESTLNIDAWSKATVLKIGDVSYDVNFNTPVVINLSLPEYIVAGCVIRPHFILECALLEDCIFTWYRTAGSDLESLSDSSDWIKCGEGFHYFISSEDVGSFLKCVCRPRMGEKVGPDFTTVSKNVIESGPQVFPFEERQIYTQVLLDTNKFRCVSYNTLANMYVEKRKFPYASNKARDVYYRRQLLLRELLGYNGDIICLQEVQERVFEYDIYPVLQKFGFGGHYTRKGGRRSEGLATFFRSSKFRVLFSKSILLNEIVKDKDIFGDLLGKVSGNYKDMSKLLAQDTALQVLLLEAVGNISAKILIANTHLYSNKNMPEVRLLQAALCVYYLEHLMKSEAMESISLLFCGDFNSLPNSEAYDFLTSGNFQCCPSWKNNNINSNLNKDTTLRHNLSLESACGIPAYTNYTEEFQGCLDYIFYSRNSLVVTDVVPMPSHESVTAEVGLPSELFPSDHIALICTLKWKIKES